MAAIYESNRNIIEDIQNLVEVVNSIGGYVNEDIEFIVSNDNSDKGVGIFSKNSIEPGMLLIKIPYSLCLSYDMISCDQHLSKVLRENEFLKDMPDEVLALSIMYASDTKNECEWTNQ